MTGPELWSRWLTLVEDVRRRASLFAAPRDSLRIRPGPLLKVTASLIADEACGEMGWLGSGNWKLLAEDEPGKLRPRGPSGDGCRDVLVDSCGTIRGLRAVGLVLPDDMLTAEAGVMVKGRFVSILRRPARWALEDDREGGGDIKGAGTTGVAAVELEMIDMAADRYTFGPEPTTANC